MRRSPPRVLIQAVRLALVAGCLGLLLVAYLMSFQGEKYDEHPTLEQFEQMSK